jgi:signal transduction histidine kinase
MKNRFSFRRSLVFRQVVYFLLVAFTIIAILATYFFLYSREAIINRTYDQLTAIRETKKNQVEYLISDKMRHLGYLADSPVIGELMNQQEGSTYNQHNINGLLAYPGIINIHIAEEVGDTLFVRSLLDASQTPLPDSMVSLLHARVIAGDTPVVSDFFVKGGDEHPMVMLFAFHGTPATTGLPEGVMIIFEISIGTITGALLEYSAEKGFGNTGEAYLVGPDFLMRSESRFIDRGILRIAVRSDAVARALQGKEGVMVTTDYRNIRVYSSFAPVSLYGLHWAILSEIDYSEAMTSIISMRNDIIFLTVIIALFMLSISIFLAYTIVNPIKRLEKAVVRFGQGEEQIRVSGNGEDEIGILTRAFNQMADQLSGKTAALFHEQEVERQRISRELHDGLGQILAGIKLKMENLGELEQRGKGEILGSAKINLSSAIDELHRISTNLRPPVLTELGLITALRNLCTDFEKDSGVPCEMSDFGDFAGIPLRVSNYLYRICQEGLTNISKHARATHVQLQTIENSEHWIVILEDNGVGFSVSKPMLYKGNGLFNMHERVMLLDGKITIESATGEGTTLRVKIPKNRHISP